MANTGDAVDRMPGSRPVIWHQRARQVTRFDFDQHVRHTGQRGNMPTGQIDLGDKRLSDRIRRRAATGRNGNAP